MSSSQIRNDQPIAFIDIDGVLNRLTSNKAAKKRNLLRHHGWSAGLRWPLWLDLQDERRLSDLKPYFELAWGSTWEDDAYPEVGKRLGLYEYEIIARSNPDEENKAHGILRAAAGRPFVWFEDDTGYVDVLDSLDIEQPYLLVSVDPVQGLTDEHIQQAIEWSQSLDAEAPAAP